MNRAGWCFAALWALSFPVLAEDKAARTIYTNEEQVYFDAEAGRPAVPWIGVIIAGQGKRQQLQAVDRFGAPVIPPVPLDRLKGQRERNGVLALSLPDGRTAELRRAKPVTCWAAVKKDKPKADGKEDWHFEREVKFHDQGGRAIIGQGVEGAKPFVIRMRRVTWAGSKSASNRPSLVLYVHRPEEPDYALSYSWADERASRIGINLRWMQASCTIDGAEAASKVTNSNFRG